MARPIDELVGLLGFEYDPNGLKQFQEGLKSASSLVKKFVAGVSAAVTGTVAMAITTAKSGDEYSKLSRIVGVSAEKIQEYEFAGRRAGLTNESIRGSFKKLKIDLGQLNRGLGPLRSSLNNVDNELLNQLILTQDVEEGFNLVIDAIAKAPNDLHRLTIATAAFGASGQEMVNLAIGGSKELAKLRSEFRELGGGISNEAALASEVLIDRWEDLTSAGRNIKNLIGAELIPIVTKYAVILGDWIKNNKELIKSKAASYVQTWLDILRKGVFILTKIILTIKTFTDLLGGLESTVSILIATFAAFKLSKIAIGLISIFKAFKLVSIGAALAGSASSIALAGIPVLIAGIVFAMTWLNKNWDKVRAVFSTSLNWIKNLFLGVWEVITNNPVFSAISKVITLYIKLWGSFAATIINSFKAIASHPIFKFFGKVLSGIGNFFKSNRTLDFDPNRSKNRAVASIPETIRGASAFAATGGVTNSRVSNATRNLNQDNQITIVTDNPQAAGAAVDQTLRRWSDETAYNLKSLVF